MAEAAEDQSMTVTDPVCGMHIEIDEAAAQEEHGEWAYFFCSNRCHRLFKADPQPYVTRAQPLTISAGVKTKKDDHE